MTSSSNEINSPTFNPITASAANNTADTLLETVKMINQMKNNLSGENLNASSSASTAASKLTQ